MHPLISSAAHCRLCSCLEKMLRKLENWQVERVGKVTLLYFELAKLRLTRTVISDLSDS